MKPILNMQRLKNYGNGILKGLSYVIISVCLGNCSSKPIVVEPQYIEKGLQASKKPFSVSVNETQFFKDIVYGEDPRNIYDFFKPNGKEPSSLVILIHGGGFNTGDKSNYYDAYRYKSMINELLENNIAVACINYRFIDHRNNAGILNSLQDAKKALQHMRFHAEKLHFDASKVVLFGNSAGAATALWLGFQEEMNTENLTKTIASMTTRVQGIVAIDTQANYDIFSWHQTVFSDFKNKGFNKESVEKLIGAHRIYGYYGVQDATDMQTEAVENYKQKTNILDFLSADDPEFYVFSDQFSKDMPTNMSEVFHHPMHLKTIQRQAQKVGANGNFYCPRLAIDTTNGESYLEFIIRKIGRKK